MRPTICKEYLTPAWLGFELSASHHLFNFICSRNSLQPLSFYKHMGVLPSQSIQFGQNNLMGFSSVHAADGVKWPLMLNSYHVILEDIILLRYLTSS